nr:hypothetical protein [Marinobacter sp. DS40M8]
MKILALHTLAFLHVHRRALLVFYLFFTGLVLAAIAPLFSSALAALRPITGHAAISTGGWCSLWCPLAAYYGSAQRRP